jgi:hypothetical protein
VCKHQTWRVLRASLSSSAAQLLIKHRTTLSTTMLSGHEPLSIDSGSSVLQSCVVFQYYILLLCEIIPVSAFVALRRQNVLASVLREG